MVPIHIKSATIREVQEKQGKNKVGKKPALKRKKKKKP